MPRKAVSKKQKVQSVPPKEEKKKQTSLFAYLRFGESYTSLILGIIVVIIATALLLSFVHNKNAGNVNPTISEQTQNTVQVSQQANKLAQQAPNNIKDTNKISPTETVAPTITTKPTEKPVVKPTAAPTKVITKAKPTPTVTVKKVSKISPTPEKKENVSNKGKNVWVVQKNESLWIIAEQKYGSGYNWVDIAKANNLADPSDIHVGDKLILPSVTPQPSTLAVAPTVTPTVITKDEQFSSTIRTNAITGTSYNVVKGDTLWDIAVRAYGDGYRWTDIAKANNLVNPSVIHSGNHLVIPR